MWPAITYETFNWDRSPDDFEMIPKSRRRRIAPTYDAAIPAPIKHEEVTLSNELALRIAELRSMIARFDQEQKARSYNLPALLLRSESSSSSQIERLTSSAKNVALAELSSITSSNAQLIAHNIAAMRTALNQKDDLDLNALCLIHSTLMQGTNEYLGIRTEQVWIGGTPYSPHDANFVPPHPQRVKNCLEDLFEFGKRTDIDAIVKAALFHAQFETIHPFTDGNGRTGRALLHRMLSTDNILMYATLPISAGLLHDITAYMNALNDYHEGNIESIITCIVEALELGVVLGGHLAQDVDAVLEEWYASITTRRDSAIYRLPTLLVEQPVVNTAYIANRFEITDRAARNLIEAACEIGILKKMGNAKRGAFYQAPALISILEEVSNVSGIRRLAAR